MESLESEDLGPLYFCGWQYNVKYFFLVALKDSGVHWFEIEYQYFERKIYILIKGKLA